MARSGKETRVGADSENKGEKQENDEIPGCLRADSKHDADYSWPAFLSLV